MTTLISTALMATGPRDFRVAVWIQKSFEKAKSRSVYTISFEGARHDSSEDALKAEINAALQALFGMHKLVDEYHIHGKAILWQTASLPLIQILAKANAEDDPEPEVWIQRYLRCRLLGVKAIPMSLSYREEALRNSLSPEPWTHSSLPSRSFREVIETKFGPLELTKGALVRFWDLCVKEVNASAIKMLTDRFNSEHLEELPVPSSVLDDKRNKYGESEETHIYLHRHWPSIRFTVSSVGAQSVKRLVDVYKFQERKAKRKPDVISHE
ncbi:UNVERIFIED_ORG: hypothetical protein M2414_004130 [Rahnella aquatilis]